MRSLWRVIRAPLIAAGAFEAMCMWAGGLGLGALLGGLGVVTIIGPALALRERELPGRMLAMGAVVDGIAVVWLAVVGVGPLTLGEWIECYLVLAAYAALLLAVVQLCWKMRLDEVGAAAIGVVVGILWMTWPVWLAEVLVGPSAERAVGWLVRVHPLFAINGVVKEMGIWSEQGIAYRVTNLNRSVAYALPDTILWCVGAHAVIAVTLLVMARSLPEREGEPCDQ